jgi:hypothetical protein
VPVVGIRPVLSDHATNVDEHNDAKGIVRTSPRLITSMIHIMGADDL